MTGELRCPNCDRDARFAWFCDFFGVEWAVCQLCKARTDDEELAAVNSEEEVVQ